MRERWKGLKLRTVASTSGERTWAEPLLGTYAERRVAELIPGADVAIQTLLNGNGDRRFRSARAMQRMLGEKSVIQKRPDGKPEVSGNGRLEVSVSHAGDLTLAVSGRGPIGCDVEPVTPRAESVWQDLLGRERFGLAQVVAEEAAENHDAAATRVWAALESLKKAGAMMDAPPRAGVGRRGRLGDAHGRAVYPGHPGGAGAELSRTSGAGGRGEARCEPMSTDT